MILAGILPIVPDDIAQEGSGTPFAGRTSLQSSGIVEDGVDWRGNPGIQREGLPEGLHKQLPGRRGEQAAGNCPGEIEALLRQKRQHQVA